MFSDDLFLDRFRPHDIDDEPCDEAAQVEATIESVGEGSQVVLPVLAVPQRVERDGQRGLQIAQHGVDPLELRQLPELALADDFDAVSAPGFSDRGEAAQAVAEYVGARYQVGAGPHTWKSLRW